MNLEQFFEEERHTALDQKWGTDKEKQTRLRIKLAIAAYAYEIMNHSIMSDADFDKQCLEVDLSIDTDNKELDSFFRKEFDPSTGQWIHKHPEKRKIGYLLEKYYNVKNN